MLYFNIYNLMPYGENARMGDTATGQLKYYFRQNLDLMVAKTQDPAGADYLNLLETLPSALPTYSNDLLFKFILWYDPNVPTGGLKNLPKVMWFGPGTYDYIVMRTGWGPNDEVITFHSGDGFAHHQHLDQGSFTVTRGEPLIIDSGTNASEGTDQRENYYTRTTAHDSMNIRQDGEAFQSVYFGGWSANDGGQRVYDIDINRISTEVDPKLSTYLANKNNGVHFETGNIVDLNVNPDYVYVQGDYTQAYNNMQYKLSQNAKVQMVTRQLVMFAPDWLVVKDRVLTTQSYYRTRFPLQLIGTPSVNGTVFTWDEGGAPVSDGELITVQGKGVTLYSRALFPEAHRTINRTGTGREYWSDSTNRVGGAFADPMAGIGRVDVQDETDTMNHEFLNVMNIQPKGSGTGVPNIEKIDETEVMGAAFNHTMAIFSRTDKDYTWASVNTTQNGTTKVHAFDIFPSVQYPIMVLHKGTNKVDLLSATSDKNATLDFTTDLTGDDQIIIGWSTTGDLSIDSLTYTPAKPNNGDNITLKAIVKNRSTYSFTMCNWFLDFYNGNPDAGGKLLGTDKVDVWPLASKAYTWVTNFTWTKAPHQVYARLRFNSICSFTDSDGTDNTQTASIVVNGKPVPIIVAPAWAWVDEVVDFDGSQSYDLEGQLQPKKWNWGDGSPNETGTTLTHRYLTVGNYSVKLTVTDMNGVSNFTVHAMAIKDLLRTPEPYFWLYLSPSADIGNVTSMFIFNSTSVDPDHVIEWFQWDFGDGTNATGPNVAHRYQQQGFYNVSMTIGWNGNLTATAWWHWLKVANLPPHAVAMVNGSLAFTTYKNEPLVFDASASIDPDDPVELHTYRWYFDKADPLNTQDGTVVTHTYHRSGVYSVRLMVREIVDDIVYMDNATVLVTIKNRPPTANISCQNFTLEWNETLWVDAWRSSDPDKDTLQYLWDFGDNTTPNHNMVGKHKYNTAGTYKVTLTVTDSDGASATASITIVQKPEPQNPPPPPPKNDSAKKMMYIIAAGVCIGVVVAVLAAVLFIRRKKAKETAEQEKAANEKAEEEAAAAAAAQQAQVDQQQYEQQQYYPQQYPQGQVENQPGYDDQSGGQQYQGSTERPPDDFQEVPKEQAFLNDQAGGQETQQGQSPEDGQNDGQS